MTKILVLGMKSLAASTFTVLLSWEAMMPALASWRMRGHVEKEMEALAERCIQSTAIPSLPAEVMDTQAKPCVTDVVGIQLLQPQADCQLAAHVPVSPAHSTPPHRAEKISPAQIAEW